MRRAKRLGHEFFSRPTELVALDLLGCTLVSLESGQRLSGRIVETEAYLDESDLASHAAIYQRGRVSLSREPGTIYMYRAYGIHMMFNIVARDVRPHGAVLVRAVEPIDGISVMQDRRQKRHVRDLASGPGKLCQAFGFSLEDHLRDITTDGSLYIERGRSVDRVRVGPRVGITRSVDMHLRFFDVDSPCVSAHRRGIDWQASRPLDAADQPKRSTPGNDGDSPTR